MKQGLHLNIPHAAYHADPCETPSLSSSVARLLLSQSPKHAWQAHPKFGGGLHEEASEAQDRGTIIHSLVLGGGPGFVAVDADDWKTKAARAQRDAARADGMVPILARKLDECRAVAEEILTPACPLWGPHATRESTAVWLSDGRALCRARIDLYEAGGVLRDLKTCENAKAASSGPAVFRGGLHVQAAAYIDAIETLFPDLVGRVKFRFLFVEVRPPLGKDSMIEAELTGEFLELGRRQWRRAVRTWAACLEHDDWPGYGDGVQRIEPPGWALELDINETMNDGFRENEEKQLNGERLSF